MQPVSDHNLVQLQLNTSASSSESHDQQSNHPVPEAATFNLYRANTRVVKELLSKTDWTECLATGNTDIKTKFDKLVAKCLHNAKVPKIKHFNNHNQVTKEINDLQTLVEIKESKTQHDNSRHADIANLANEIKEINQNIQQLIEEADKQCENKVLQNIQANPRAFYKYANSFKNSASTIFVIPAPFCSNNSNLIYETFSFYSCFHTS